MANAGNSFRLETACGAMLMFTQVGTSARNVANVVETAVHWTRTGDVIRERNRLNVLFVANDSRHQQHSDSTAEFTVETNRTNVACVTRRLVSLER